MLSAAQRQAKLAKKVKARKQRQLDLDRQAAIWQREDRRKYSPDRSLLTLDKREELYGRGDDEGGYTDAQCEYVDALVDAYTPEEFAAALAQANALDWPDYDSDECFYDRRVEHRRKQGRGPAT
jgi:hypothetical protein